MFLILKIITNLLLCVHPMGYLPMRKLHRQTGNLPPSGLC